jgi:hypothetical protein
MQDGVMLRIADVGATHRCKIQDYLHPGSAARSAAPSARSAIILHPVSATRSVAHPIFAFDFCIFTLILAFDFCIFMLIFAFDYWKICILREKLTKTCLPGNKMLPANLYY